MDHGFFAYFVRLTFCWGSIQLPVDFINGRIVFCLRIDNHLMTGTRRIVLEIVNFGCHHFSGFNFSKIINWTKAGMLRY